MQTFLPYPDFKRSLECLDPSRLGNQVYREGLTLAGGGWPNHPASKMWRGHEFWLCEYCLIGLNVLYERGLNYLHHVKTFEELQAHYGYKAKPAWLGREDIHASHRSNLLRKDPIYYGQFGWTEPDNLPYVWPV